MKKFWLLFSAASISLMFCSCASPDAQPAATGGGSEISSWTSKCNEAKAMASKGDLQSAYILYQDARSLCSSEEEQRQLSLLITDILIQMKRYPAALASLGKMPEFPVNLDDCRKMFLAARILDKMKSKNEYIEALMIVALDVPLEDSGAMQFKADGYAELGNILIQHEKISQAQKCFSNAAELYEKLQDKKRAATCRNIKDYLQ